MMFIGSVSSFVKFGGKRSSFVKFCEVCMSMYVLSSFTCSFFMKLTCYVLNSYTNIF